MKQIELINGHWHVNSKKIKECNEQERIFFGKYIKLNEFATQLFNTI